MEFQFNNLKINQDINYFKYILVLFFIILFFFEIVNQSKSSKINLNNSFRPSGNNITKLDINHYIADNHNKTLILLNGKKYIDKCLNEHNITKINKKDFKPVISAIIPVYNCEKTIYSSISSIINQNFSEFEIILINDFSKDNSSKIIGNLLETDSRIKILNNKKNMGSLYSRSMGVLMSRGEYIFPLDNDDMFFSSDLFSSIINIAQGYNFDIVGFRATCINSYEDINIKNIYDLYDYNFYPDTIIVHQPKLSTWMIVRDGIYLPHDVTIWGKCIKSKIYKEAIIQIGQKRISIFVSWAEDTIINFIIFSLAQSFIFTHKYGIIHLNNPITASYSMPEDIRIY